MGCEWFVLLFVKKNCLFLLFDISQESNDWNKESKNKNYQSNDLNDLRDFLQTDEFNIHLKRKRTFERK